MQVFLFLRLFKSLLILQKWSHEFAYEREHDPRVKDFLAGKFGVIRNSINPRDFLFGGRCSVFKLHAKAGEGERIRYLDVVR